MSLIGSPWLDNPRDAGCIAFYTLDARSLPPVINCRLGSNARGLRSSAVADLAVFGRLAVLTDSAFLAPRRSGGCSRCFECWIAVSICITELACGMLPHVTCPRPRDRTPGRSETSPSLQKKFGTFHLVRSLIDSSADPSFCCCGNSWFARLM